jgi:glycine/D-amino acid oxidase-like deaminating enzyme
MSPARKRVAILGAGIMGTSLALFLARRNVDVSLFDREGIPVACASRWNEGKIHLGYLYGADPSMRTARHVLPGGLAFGRLISELVGYDIAPHVTPDDDIYLVHRHSVVDADALASSFEKVSALVRGHADACEYLADVSAARARPLSPGELRHLTDSEEIVAGFVTPERSVNTRWVADGLCAALESEPRIRLYTNVTIQHAGPVDSVDGDWRVRGEPDLDERFDIVVNALWNGRLEIDRAAGVQPEPGWSHRYRLCVFARTRDVVDIRSAVVAVGPFGDIKNYNGRDFYLSWYPVGLMAESNAVSLQQPQPLTDAEKLRFITDVRAALGSMLPATTQVFEAAEELKVEGGFVFAMGQGSLGDPVSTIHRRDRFGVHKHGRYFSVDTGKYSTAPWLARNLAKEICGD